MGRILIIEDDVDIRESLTQVLEMEGYDVAVACDGCQGLLEARRAHPDVILLDLMMPVMDGWQFRSEQKRDERIAGIPVVVVSALGRRPELDAAAYIPKPCNVDDVLAAVGRQVTA